MSWPGADDTPPSESGAGDFGDSGVRGDRPTDLASLGALRENRRVRFSRAQVDRSLKLLSTPFESLPQLPFFAPWFGYTKDWQKGEVAGSLIGNSLNIGRIVTPAEADALAELRAQFCSRIAWTPPAVLAASLYFTYRGRTTFRFPFYTPKPASFNPTAFPTAARPFLTGPPAVRLWHFLRFNAYGLICLYVVKSVVTSFSQASYLMGVFSDKRLKAVRENLAEKAKAARSQRQHGFPPVNAPNAEPPASGEAAPYRASSWSRPEQQQQLQQRQQPPPPPSPQPAQWTQRTPESQAPPQDDDDFLFDDASPVAPSQRQQPQGSSASSLPGQSSSWDRIRQRAKAEEGAPWQQQGSESQGQQTTEQYTFAPGEQEKAYAKEQAQREFDAMLERERRGVGDSGERR